MNTQKHVFSAVVANMHSDAHIIIKSAEPGSSADSQKCAPEPISGRVVDYDFGARVHYTTSNGEEAAMCLLMPPREGILDQATHNAVIASLNRNTHKLEGFLNPRLL